MLVLNNGTLIDGTGHEVIEKTTIVVEENRIRSIGLQQEYPREANIIDLTSLVVMPGLIDCHLHLGGIVKNEPGQSIGKVSFVDMISYMWDYFRDYAHRRRLAIENGVTSIRSAGDHYPHIVKLREKIKSGKLNGPRIFTPGPIFTAPGGHPASTIYKGNRYIVEHVTRQVEDINSAREEVKRLVDGGVDCIKAVYGDVDPMNLSRKVPKLALKVLDALVDEAHKQKLRTMLHTGNPEDTMDVVRIGSDSIEHGILPGAISYDFDDTLINMMLDKKTYFVPTMAIAWAYNDMYPDFFLALQKAVKELYDAGINIAVGTDSSAPGAVIGKAVHKELELLVEAGISPMEAIVCGTKKSAENIGQGNELGTIETGKLADMVVITGNPTISILDTRNIKLVVKDGRILINKLG